MAMIQAIYFQSDSVTENHFSPGNLRPATEPIKGSFCTGTRDMLSEKDVCDSVYPFEWWVDPISVGYVFRLKKANYGTKQAARIWHTKISK
jgi:hypothetical protein